MSEQQITETTDTEVEQTEDQSLDVETPEQTEDPTDEKKGNSEAAKWRVKLREAEGTITSLQARVGDMQAAEVSRLATGPGALHDGQDLLLTTRLDDLLDDEGNVSADLVAEQVTALVEKKPHLAKPAFDGGVGIGEKGTATGTSWADVISG